MEALLHAPLSTLQSAHNTHACTTCGAQGGLARRGTATPGPFFKGIFSRRIFRAALGPLPGERLGTHCHSMPPGVRGTCIRTFCTEHGGAFSAQEGCCWARRSKRIFSRRMFAPLWDASWRGLGHAVPSLPVWRTQGIGMHHLCRSWGAGAPQGGAEAARPWRRIFLLPLAPLKK